MEWKAPYNPHLHKEIPQSYEQWLSPEAEAELAEQSLYGAWWAYLKASPDYPPRGPDSHSGPIAELYKDFGELGSSFADWWRRRGRDLFKETEMVPHIELCAYDTEHGPQEHPAYVVLKIPLTISREAILDQFNQVMKRVHPGNKLLRHSYSTAQRKIYPRPRYHRSTYMKLLEVWQAKQERPEAAWWDIGEHLNISPALNVTDGDDDSAIADKHRDLGTITRNMYEQAEELMFNALRGEFPKDKDVVERQKKKKTKVAKK
jgi:hypothetical protein